MAESLNTVSPRVVDLCMAPMVKVRRTDTNGHKWRPPRFGIIVVCSTQCSLPRRIPNYDSLVNSADGIVLRVDGRYCWGARAAIAAS